MTRRDAILSEIQSYAAQHGRAPTRRWIAATLGIPTSSVQHHVTVLAGKGMIVIGDGGKIEIHPPDLEPVRAALLDMADRYPDAGAELRELAAAI